MMHSYIVEFLTSLLVYDFTCCQFQYYDLAADVLAENATLTYKFLSTVSTMTIYIYIGQNLRCDLNPLTHCIPEHLKQILGKQ